MFSDINQCGFEKEKRGLESPIDQPPPADYETDPFPDKTGAPQELIAKATQCWFLDAMAGRIVNSDCHGNAFN